MTTELNQRLPQDPALLSIAVGMLVEALTKTLVKLAAANGNRAGDWLDQLEATTIGAAKGTYGEGATSLALEHAGAALGIALLQERFQALRLALAQHGDGGAAVG